MKIMLLAGANSIHTARWANGLVSRGHEVHVVSAHRLTHAFDERVYLHLLSRGAPWAYLLGASEVRAIARLVAPDILNAHYATGYGLLARLVAYVPTLLSVWGSDVYTFPGKSLLHRQLVLGNLKSCTAVASTSHCMARRVAQMHRHPHVFVTPFGVDTQVFKPDPEVMRPPDQVVIGTVKSLSSGYGIDVLIRAFAWAWDSLGRPHGLRLEISGEGPQRAELEALAETMGVRRQLTFFGEVAHAQVPTMLRRLDVFVALSRFESFGVAVLEAAACQLPVVVSNAEGLAEVTVGGVNGYIVPREDALAAGEALEKLIRDPALRQSFGEAGRRHVVNHYSWESSLDIMLDAYKRTSVLATCRPPGVD
jgi:glycosyltransferase involved in cell wall biosynthesis